MADVLDLLLALQRQFGDAAIRFPDTALEVVVLPSNQIGNWLFAPSASEPSEGMDCFQVGFLFNQGSFVIEQHASRFGLDLPPVANEDQLGGPRATEHCWWVWFLVQCWESTAVIPISKSKSGLIGKNPNHRKFTYDNVALKSKTVTDYLFSRCYSRWPSDSSNSPEGNRNVQQTWVTADTSTNKVAVDNCCVSVEPHLAQMVKALVDAKESGDWWVTGPTMQNLPGCSGKKISREMKKLYSICPQLKEEITSKSPFGYRLKR